MAFVRRAWILRGPAPPAIIPYAFPEKDPLFPGLRSRR